MDCRNDNFGLSGGKKPCTDRRRVEDQAFASDIAESERNRSESVLGNGESPGQYDQGDQPRKPTRRRLAGGGRRTGIGRRSLGKTRFDGRIRHISASLIASNEGLSRGHSDRRSEICRQPAEAATMRST